MATLVEKTDSKCLPTLRTLFTASHRVLLFVFNHKKASNGVLNLQRVLSSNTQEMAGIKITLGNYGPHWHGNMHKCQVYSAAKQYCYCNFQWLQHSTVLVRLNVKLSFLFLYSHCIAQSIRRNV